MTLAQLCAMFENCLPQSEYRTKLEQLHAKMLNEMKERSMTVVTFTVPGLPKGKGRANIVAYEGLIADSAKQAMAGAQLIEDAAACNIFIYMPVPASWSDKKRRLALEGEFLPTTRPDIYNVVKAVLDGCNGVIWWDDVQVVDLRVRKRYSSTPCVWVEVWRAAQPLGVPPNIPPLT